MVSRFVYGSRANVPDYLIRGGTTYRVVSDQLGSPRLVVDAATGEVAQRMDYGPFGKVTLDTDPGFQPFGFVGGLYDPATKLIRFGLRDYDPETGRWTTKDPLGFAGGDPNLYAYAGNDPVNAVDVYGMQAYPPGPVPSVAANLTWRRIKQFVVVAWSSVELLLTGRARLIEEERDGGRLPKPPRSRRRNGTSVDGRRVAVRMAALIPSLATIP